MTKTIPKPNKKLQTIIIVCGLALIFGTGSGICQITKGPAEMVLQTAKAKKPATFPHAQHQEILQCGACHHGKSAEGKQIPYSEKLSIGRCITCHNKTDMANDSLNSFKSAAHAKCKSCHADMKKAGKATGPTKCSGCHN